MDFGKKTWQNLNMEQAQENTQAPEITSQKASVPLQESVEKQTPSLLLATKKGKFITGALVTTVCLVLALGYLLMTSTLTPDKERLPTRLRPEDEKTETLETYINNKYGFSFRYPKELNFAQQDTDEEKITQFALVYSGKNQQNTVETDRDLVDGYIFKVRIHETIDTDAQEIARRKKEKLLSDCPTIAKASELAETYIDKTPAYKFEIKNCPQTYIQTFALKYNKVFEFVQVYRGDLGFDQAYATKTNDILKTFKFLRDESPPESDKALFKSDEYTFTFTHPKLNTTCCTITGPTSESAQNLATLADLEDTRQKFNGIGLFVEKNPNNLTFEAYINEQKQTLIKEYRVIVGTNPQTSEKIVNVGGITGIRLDGYAWWGDVVYLQLPQKSVGRPPQFLIIVKAEVKDGDFEETFNEILDSFDFELLETETE